MYETKFCQVEYMPKYNAVWITDTTNVFESESEDTQWLLEDFMPKAIDSSCGTIVFVIKKNSPLKYEIDGQAKALSEYFNVRQVETLGEMEEAIEI